MRAAVLMAAAALASSGMAHAGGSGVGHGSSHGSRIYRSSASEHFNGGYGRRRYAGPLGYRTGVYAGYGFENALNTDTGGYDAEGLPQPYFGPDGASPYPAPPFLASTGYGPGYSFGPRPGAIAQGVHISGEGAYAYGYNGYAETPALPYGEPASPAWSGYGQTAPARYPGAGYGYQSGWASPVCGC